MLALLSSAMALIFYQQLPLQLIHFIFTVEFLERVDRELRACYSRVMKINQLSVFFIDFENCLSQAVYPVKVRQLMMELNRAVCLDCPQADIPWFHEKYCLENVVRPSNQGNVPSSNYFCILNLLFFLVYHNPMHKEVYQTLSQVAGGADYIKQNTYSPYYYNLGMYMSVPKFLFHLEYTFYSRF